MSTGEPSGLLVMNGVVYQDINGSGFFGILKDGTAVIGTKEDYLNTYKGQVAEGIAGFGTMLVENGQICVSRKENHTSDRASRTAVGITRTGKVVFMVLDGRQEPWSCGGSWEEIAQIMLEAGCVNAINLDGGGSTTYIAKQEGATELSVTSRPSDGAARSVSTSLIMVSTAPSSTAFDHANLSTKTNYMTVGASMQVTPLGVSATGNSAELPEGTTWAVSDTRWATITEDGMLTALRNGDVDVYLMLGDEVIGSKTIHIVIPTQIYFVKSTVNAVYGQAVTLPVKALYENKEVTIRPSDIVFTMSNATAGVIDGFNFVGDETAGIKMVTITAALANDESISANITLRLYKQGENTFDFEQAIGGNRELAWDRQVSNATTEDAITYVVVDQTKDMVTSYVFAIDMTQIPIPAQLEDLIYMLPGADMEDASAWNFLLQLAERVSVLSEVKPVLRFDPNFVVDYSELKLVNEYFELAATEFDEQTNSLTLTLKWIDQTQPIDPAMANPLCLVSGIKLTPKADAQWNEKAQLKVVNSGEISYKIYLRASALYTFAQKPENQEIYGLYDYVNPNDEKDKGGYFGSVYNTFEDTYTLVQVLKNGWKNEDGGFVYYKDGQKYYGICDVDGLYYDFGENGINVGKTPFSGLFNKAGKTYYAKNGELVTGWQPIGNDWYLFESKTGAGVEGTYKTTMDGLQITYEMEGGRVVKGFWYQDGVGLRYYFGPYSYRTGWKVIDGEQYFFENGYVHTGLHPVRESHNLTLLWYVFAEDGKLIGEAPDGFHWYNGELYYIEDIVARDNGLNLIDGDYYYFNSNDTAARNVSIWVSKTNGLLSAGTYRFGDDGKMIMAAEIVNENGTLYYYKNGKRTASAGVVEWNGDYYYIDGAAQAAAGKTVWVSNTNGLVKAGSYRFGADGKMNLNTEVASVDGTLYYFKNGLKTAGAGLVEYNGDYYYIDGAAKAVTNQVYWVSKTNGLMAVGSYRFGADGKMLRTTGIVDGYYYKDGAKTAEGLVLIDGNYYYAGGGAKIVTNEIFWITKTNNLLPVGTYRTDADGKFIMTTEVVNENGTLYYYKDGKRTGNAGLVEFNGDYYYIDGGAKAAIDQVVWVSKTNDFVKVGSYKFGADGKMIRITGIMDGYYYKDGAKTAAGLVLIDGDYYYADGAAKIITNSTFWASNTSNMLPVGTYRAGADGKLIMTTEIVNENGVLYYYQNGRRTGNAGLVEFNGDYYYIDGGAKAMIDQVVWVNKTNGLVAVGSYKFGADGKMIRITGIMDGYYYKDGAKTAEGLVLIDGNYYYAGSGAKIVTNEIFWITKANNLLPIGTYRTDAEGKFIMTTEVVNENGTVYYYQNGKRTGSAGLVEFNGDYYYIDGAAKAAVDQVVWVSKTNGLVKAGSYKFDANGKMIRTTGIVDGYYYKDGLKTAAGLVLIDGDYYYVDGGAKVITNSSFWVSNTHDMLPAGTYRADAEGKLILKTEIVDENGALYYYQNGRRTGSAGLVEFNGDYYYIDGAAKAVVDQRVWVSKTNGLVEVGSYTFDKDGKMVR